MQSFKNTASADAVMARRPVCPKCGMLMLLTRIEPDAPGHDNRTFECPACLYEESAIVKFR